MNEDAAICDTVAKLQVDTGWELDEIVLFFFLLQWLALSPYSETVQHHS